MVGRGFFWVGGAGWVRASEFSGMGILPMTGRFGDGPAPFRSMGILPMTGRVGAGPAPTRPRWPCYTKAGRATGRAPQVSCFE